MQTSRKIVVIIIAFATAATGFFEIVSDWQSNFYFWINPFRCFADLDPFFIVLGSVVMVLPVLKLITAVGLFMNKPWAWFSAIVVLTADFVFRANGAVTMFMLDAFTPAMPEISIPEGSVSMTIPMWPSYVIAIISIGSIFVLIQKPIKTEFCVSRA